MSNVSDHSDSEVINAFLMQFYQNSIPKNIISNYTILGETVSAIEKHFGHKIRIYNPKRGRKLKTLGCVCNYVKRYFYFHTQVTCYLLSKKRSICNTLQKGLRCMITVTIQALLL